MYAIYIIYKGKKLYFNGIDLEYGGDWNYKDSDEITPQVALLYPTRQAAEQDVEMIKKDVEMLKKHTTRESVWNQIPKIEGVPTEDIFRYIKLLEGENNDLYSRLQNVRKDMYELIEGL